MKLTAQKIPEEFVRSIPRGFRLVQKQGCDFLLVESLFCPNGHNLIVDSVRIHDEASVKLKIVVNHQPGFVFCKSQGLATPFVDGASGKP